MNPIDILGELLGAGASGGGGGGAPGARRGGGGGGGGSLGAEILKEILGGAMGGASGGMPSGGSSRSGSAPSGPSASDLEDMLGVGTGPTTQTRPPAKPATPQSPSRPQAPTGDIFGQNPPAPAAPKNEPSISEKEKAIVLIRAMIFAGKADGQIDASEQQSILDRIGDASQETVQFLRTEFANAQSVRDFAWSVPLGLEQSVYSISLATIDLDSPKEVAYLKELAQGLRLSPDACNQLHRQYKVKPIF